MVDEKICNVRGSSLGILVPGGAIGSRYGIELGR